MNHETLKLANEDWAHCLQERNGHSFTLCADDLIALAVDCRRQTHQTSAPFTAEDAKILQRRAPLCVIDAEGNYRSFSNDLPTLRYLLNLNV